MVKSKKKRPPEPYWNKLVSVYFEFCRSRFNDEPSFDGSAPRDMKNILIYLRTRAEAKDIEWTEEIAATRWKSFIEYAFTNRWLAENWLLSNINRQKDAIVFNSSKQQSNG